MKTEMTPNGLPLSDSDRQLLDELKRQWQQHEAATNPPQHITDLMLEHICQQADHRQRQRLRAAACSVAASTALLLGIGMHLFAPNATPDMEVALLGEHALPMPQAPHPPTMAQPPSAHSPKQASAHISAQEPQTQPSDQAPPVLHLQCNHDNNCDIYAMAAIIDDLLGNNSLGEKV